jgi:hypothetical protein
MMADFVFYKKIKDSRGEVKPTWIQGLNVIVDTNVVSPIPQYG